MLWSGGAAITILRILEQSPQNGSGTTKFSWIEYVLIHINPYPPPLYFCKNQDRV